MSTQPLTPEQTNVLIAESLGWKWWTGYWGNDSALFRFLSPNGSYSDGWRTGEEAKPSDMDLPIISGPIVPNFHGSLDACATMEATLTEYERHRYPAELAGVIGDMAKRFDAITATAPQRCLAYLKTKGLIK